MNSTAKKALNITTKVIAGILVAFTVFMMVFTVVSVTTLDKNDRSIFVRNIFFPILNIRYLSFGAERKPVRFSITIFLIFVLILLYLL